MFIIPFGIYELFSYTFFLYAINKNFIENIIFVNNKKFFVNMDVIRNK